MTPCKFFEGCTKCYLLYIVKPNYPLNMIYHHSLIGLHALTDHLASCWNGVRSTTVALAAKGPSTHVQWCVYLFCWAEDFKHLIIHDYCESYDMSTGSINRTEGHKSINGFCNWIYDIPSVMEWNFVNPRERQFLAKPYRSVGSRSLCRLQPSLHRPEWLNDQLIYIRD